MRCPLSVGIADELCLSRVIPPLTQSGRNSRRVGIGTFAHKSPINITQIAPRSNCTRFEPKVRIRSVVMLMTDDTGWNDFGAYSGGEIAISRRRLLAFAMNISGAAP